MYGKYKLMEKQQCLNCGNQYILFQKCRANSSNETSGKNNSIIKIYSLVNQDKNSSYFKYILYFSIFAFYSVSNMPLLGRVIIELIKNINVF